MAAINRKPLQGVYNIVRFNWHFYALAGGSLVVLVFLIFLVPTLLLWWVIAIFGIIWGTFFSLIVSLYVYDLSGFYHLRWIEAGDKDVTHLLNIHAGFDETSKGLVTLFPHANMTIYDFYDVKSHTELSIRRARKAYSPYPGTLQISTSKLPYTETKFDLIFLIFSAHEIRNEQERISFLQQIRLCMKEGGELYLVEHFRNGYNTLAFSIGVFHFFSRKKWLNNMLAAGFTLKKEKRYTPFVSILIFSA